jgi:excisionase family DNA binding protein
MSPKTQSSGLGSLLSSRLLTIKDVAELLQVSTRTVQRLIDRGELAAVRIGRSVRIRPEAVQSLTESK